MAIVADVYYYAIGFVAIAIMALTVEEDGSCGSWAFVNDRGLWSGIQGKWIKLNDPVGTGLQIRIGGFFCLLARSSRGNAPPIEMIDVEMRYPVLEGQTESMTGADPNGRRISMILIERGVRLESEDELRDHMNSVANNVLLQ